MDTGKRYPEFENIVKLNGDVKKKTTTCDGEKNWGVTVKKTLSFDLDIQNVVNKANQVIGLIKRIFVYLNKDLSIKL